MGADGNRQGVRRPGIRFMTHFIFRYRRENGVGGHSEELSMSSVKDRMGIVDDSVARNGGDMHGDGMFVGADRSRNIYLDINGEQQIGDTARSK